MGYLYFFTTIVERPVVQDNLGKPVPERYNRYLSGVHCSDVIDNSALQTHIIVH